jgi:hypothetical protein
MVLCDTFRIAEGLDWMIRPGRTLHKPFYLVSGSALWAPLSVLMGEMYDLV